MTGQQVIRRELATTVKGITETTQRGQKVWQIQTEPRQGMKYPDNFTCRKKELRDKLEAGKAVLLILERENRKMRGSEPTGPENQPWSYYEAIVDVREPGVASTDGVAQKGASGTAQATQPEARHPGGDTEPWDRYIAWGELIAQAREVRREIYGDFDAKNVDELGDIYRGQLDYAMSIVVDAIRAQKAR